MAVRTIVHIDEEACTGCGLCVEACHEGAIQMVNGKARLLRDDYCDGLGDCLPSCPAGAITFVVREAAEYDEAAVVRAQMERAKAESHATMPAGGCPGSMAKAIVRPGAGATTAANARPVGVATVDGQPAVGVPAQAPDARCAGERAAAPSWLSQWPCQIKLAPVNATYFEGCDLLIAADCSAFAYGDFHDRFIKGRVCLIGCPKLDGVNYAEKLVEIAARNHVRTVTVVRMEVPCCGGIEFAARAAADAAGCQLQSVTISTDGRILD